MKILTPNSHTAYLYLMAKTGHEFSVLGEWDSTNRPLPSNVQLISWDEAVKNFKEYDVIIGHNVRDIPRLVSKCLRYKKPYLHVIHGRISIVGETNGALKRALKLFAKHALLKFFLKSLSIFGIAKFIFISEFNKEGWWLKGEVVDHGIPVQEMPDYTGEAKSLLIVGNRLNREHFDFKMILKIRDSLPVKLVGVNPSIEGSMPSSNWEDLKSNFRTCRAYLNLTREPERGYTLSTLEAMASGMPVISLEHPITPIRDGWNGYLVRGYDELEEKGRLLLDDIALAKRLGDNARKTILKDYGIENFTRKWNKVLLEASNK